MNGICAETEDVSARCVWWGRCISYSRPALVFCQKKCFHFIFSLNFCIEISEKPPHERVKICFVKIWGVFFVIFWCFHYHCDIKVLCNSRCSGNTTILSTQISSASFYSEDQLDTLNLFTFFEFLSCSVCSVQTDSLCLSFWQKELQKNDQLGRLFRKLFNRFWGKAQTNFVEIGWKMCLKQHMLFITNQYL